MSEVDTPQKPQAALLIGRGSRITPLVEQAAAGQLSGEIVAVVTHKPMEDDGTGSFTRDVPGIAIARAHGIPTRYLDWTTLYTEAAQGGLTKGDCRPMYFDMVYKFLTADGRNPEAIFMLGWDVIVPEVFLKRFPGPRPGVYNVINMHPALLPDNPNDDTYTLQDVCKGTLIPIIKGEHDLVLATAFSLGLPALGSTMHYALPVADEGIPIKRVEVPIPPQETYDDRLKVAEELLAIDVFEMWAKGELN